MSQKITDVFRQQKPHSVAGFGATRDEQQSKNAAAAANLPGVGVTAADATIDYDISPEERQLRLFDLDTRFGPCTGLTRMERWQRAEKFGLSPPAEVRLLLERLIGGADENNAAAAAAASKWNSNVWAGRV